MLPSLIKSFVDILSILTHVGTLAGLQDCDAPRDCIWPALNAIDRVLGSVYGTCLAESRDVLRRNLVPHDRRCGSVTTCISFSSSSSSSLDGPSRVGRRVLSMLQIARVRSPAISQRACCRRHVASSNRRRRTATSPTNYK